MTALAQGSVNKNSAAVDPRLARERDDLGAQNRIVHGRKIRLTSIMSH